MPNDTAISASLEIKFCFGDIDTSFSHH